MCVTSDGSSSSQPSGREAACDLPVGEEGIELALLDGRAIRLRPLLNPAFKNASQAYKFASAKDLYEPGENMKDPNIVLSGHCGPFTRDGVSVEVSIVRLEHESQWTLEIINASRTSIVWDDPFPSDDAAYAEFLATVEEEGMKVFLDDGNVVPFKRP